MYVCNKLSATI